MAQQPKFSQKKLEECLNQRNAAFNTAFQQFKDAFQRNDIDYIHRTILGCLKFLTGQELSPMSKMHVLRVLKYGFDCGNYLSVLLIEVVVLPHLRQVALYKKQTADLNKGKNYFVDQHKQKQPLSNQTKEEYEKVGYSYLIMVLECIEAWASVKPLYLFMDSELDGEDSDYVRNFKYLKGQEKVQFPPNKNYYKKQDIEKCKRNHTQQQLKAFENPALNQFVDYYTLVLMRGLQSEEAFKSPDMNVLRKLYAYQEIFLVQEALKILEDAIKGKEFKPSKILAMRLLGQMLKSGLVLPKHSAVSLLPEIQQTLNNIKKGDYGSNLKDAKRPTTLFYNQALKHLSLWAQTQQSEGPFKKTLSKLLASGHVAPPVSQDQTKQFKSDYTKGLKRSQVRNYMLEEQVQDKPKTTERKPADPVGSQSKIGVKLMDVPNIGTLKLNQRLQAHKQIYKAMCGLLPENEKDNKLWLEKACGFMETNQTSIDDLLESEMQNENFDALCEEAYQYVDVNDKLIKIIRKNQAHPNTLQQLQRQLKQQGLFTQPPAPATNPSVVKEDPAKKKQEQSSLEQQRRKQEEASRKKKQQQEQLQRKKKQQQQEAEARQKAIKEQQQAKDKQEREAAEAREKAQKLRLENQRKAAEQNRKAEDKRKREQQTKKAEEQQRRRKQDQRKRIERQNQIKAKQIEAEKLKAKQQEELKRQQAEKQRRRQQEQRIKKQQAERQSKINASKVDSIKGNSAKQLQAQDYRIQINQASKLQNDSRVSFHQSSDRSSSSKVIPPSPVSPAQPTQPTQPFKKQSGKVHNAVPEQLNYKPEVQELEQDQENLDVQEQSQQIQKHHNFMPKQGPNENRGGSNIVVPTTLISTQLKGISNSLPLRIPLQESRVVVMKSREEDQSEILEPNLQPLNDSFHEIEFYKGTKALQSVFNAGPTLSTSASAMSFKGCFDHEKFLIPNKSVQLAGKEKIFWLVQDAKILNSVSRSVRSESVYQPKSSSVGSFGAITLPEVLAERSEKYDKEISQMRIHHQRQVQFLEAKIKKLQALVRQKDKTLSQQQEELMSYRSVGARSEKDFRIGKSASVSHPAQLEYLENQNSLLKNKLSRQQNQLRLYQTASGFVPPSTPMSRLFERSVREYQGSIKQPKGQTFFSEPYSKYLVGINDTRIKKLMLKNKQLIFKNSCIEIGGIVSRDSTLKVALFIQSEVLLTDFAIRVVDCGFKVMWFPERFTSVLTPGKQEKIIYSFELPVLPYSIPELEFGYKLANVSQSHRAMLPCAFLRFVQYRQMEPIDFKKQFKQAYQKKPQSVLRGEQILYNKKIIKDLTSMKQHIPRFKLLNPHKEKNFNQGKSNIKYGVWVGYGATELLLRANLKPNHSMFFQAANISKSGSNPQEQAKVLEFLICTLNTTFSRDKVWG